MNGRYPLSMTALKRIFTMLAVFVLLLSSIPAAFADGGVSLMIPDGSWGTWKQVSTRRYSFKFEVKNTSTSKTVKSYDVTYYTCDGYGNQNSATETVTITQKIKPYETVESGLIYLQNPEDICTVHLAITRVRFTNGTSEVDYNPSYGYWTINEDLLVASPTQTPSTYSNRLTELLNKYSSGTKTSSALKIINDGDVICKRVSTKKYSFQFEVKNTNISKTIKSYDVTYYTCDEWGDQNSPNETVTLTQKVKPYETVMSGIIYLENPDDVYEAYIAIKTVRYTDGTTETVSTPEYASWYWEH